MTKIEEIDAVIVRHLGSSDFGHDQTPRYWARIVVDAAINDTVGFACSSDSLALEKLLRTSRSAIAEMEQLSEATKSFKPKAFAAWHIRNMLSGQKRDTFRDADVAMRNLEAWILSMRQHSTFKNQATKSRNWSAASVAGTCRTLWGAAKWEASGRKPPKIQEIQGPWPFQSTYELSPSHLKLQAEYGDFLKNHAPRSEKHEEPGPFGRFLEEVFLVLGILGNDGNSFRAASALRSFRDASKQIL